MPKRSVKRTPSGPKKTTRRQLLRRGGALAGAAAAAAMARQPAARAETGEFMVLGQANTADSTTFLTNTGGGTGLMGSSGTDGVGLMGAADGDVNGFGVVGGRGSFDTAEFIQPAGIYGITNAASTIPAHAIIGHGRSPNKAGVYGYHPGGTGTGVRAEGGHRGLYAVATKPGGVAIEAIITNGTAIRAIASVGEVGLDVDGFFKFRRSGVQFVRGTPATPRSSVKNSGEVISPRSKVFATIQGFFPGVWVAGVRVEVDSSSFTIHLNKAVKQDVPVAWFIVD